MATYLGHTENESWSSSENDNLDLEIRRRMPPKRRKVRKLPADQLSTKIGQLRMDEKEDDQTQTPILPDLHRNLELQTLFEERRRFFDGEYDKNCYAVTPSGRSQHFPQLKRSRSVDPAELTSVESDGYEDDEEDNLDHGDMLLLEDFPMPPKSKLSLAHYSKGFRGPTKAANVDNTGAKGGGLNNNNRKVRGEIEILERKYNRLVQEASLFREESLRKEMMMRKSMHGGNPNKKPRYLKNTRVVIVSYS